MYKKSHRDWATLFSSLFFTSTFIYVLKTVPIFIIALFAGLSVHRFNERKSGIIDNLLNLDDNKQLNTHLPLSWPQYQLNFLHSTSLEKSLGANFTNILVNEEELLSLFSKFDQLIYQSNKITPLTINSIGNNSNSFFNHSAKSLSVAKFNLPVINHSPPSASQAASITPNHETGFSNTYHNRLLNPFHVNPFSIKPICP